MQTIKTQVQILEDVKTNNATLSSGTFEFGPPPEFGASEKIVYPFTGAWLNNSQLNKNILTTSYKIYFANQVKTDEGNRTEVLSALHVSAIQFLAQLEYTLKYSYNARITQSTPLQDFDERWDDDVSGWECDLTIEQFFDKSVCDIPSSGANAGKVIIKDEDGNVLAVLNPNSIYTVQSEMVTIITTPYANATGTTFAATDATKIIGVFFNAARLNETVDYTISGNNVVLNTAAANDYITIVEIS